MGKGERPELQNPPEIFYDEDEAHKYTHNSRIIAIQVSLCAHLYLCLCLMHQLLCFKTCGCGRGDEHQASQSLSSFG